MHGLLSEHVSIDQHSFADNALIGDVGATGYKRVPLKSEQAVAVKAVQGSNMSYWEGSARRGMPSQNNDPCT